MMVSFDKNIFKESFRLWTEEFPQSSLEQARQFCLNHIPANSQAQYEWLVEQSLSWFAWKKELRNIQILHAMDLFEDDHS